MKKPHKLKTPRTMKTISNKYQQMIAEVPKDIQTEIDISFDIANEINTLMLKRGLSKKQFADALGKKPSEVTKWLSGQHNFTIRTLAMLSTFFDTPLIQVRSRKYVFDEEDHPTMVADDTTECFV